MYKIFKFFLILIFVVFLNPAIKAQYHAVNTINNKINLAGQWYFQIDSLDQGISEKWFRKKCSDHITLPGSMTTNLKGNDIDIHTPWTGSIFDSSWYHKPEYAIYRDKSNLKIPFWLQPVKYYKGPAWYQKEIEIPVNWKNKFIELFIERSHWETSVWIDDKFAGKANSLAAPDIFELSKLLTPGKHLLSVRIDNRIRDIDVGKNSHSITDHTQGNWNGMIGQLYLREKEPVHFDDVRIFSDIYKKQITLNIKLNDLVKSSAGFKLYAVVNKDGKALPIRSQLIKTDSAGQIISFTYAMGGHIKLWDEFHPNLYHLKLGLKRNQQITDTISLDFGMREFSSRGTQFTINNRLTFLRGTLDCAAFPLTGYPPTDVVSWLKIFRKCKSYGLNHIRFHSWCPPEAAFAAADQCGLYLQIECSSWANQGATIGDGQLLDAFIYDESNRIVTAYGNHPSFCMLLYGNEPAGKNTTKYLTGFIKYWKAKDNRRLYTTGAGWPVISESDYNSTPAPRIQQWGAGLKSIINAQNPKTDYDWRNVISKWQHPAVSHEIGQWCAYPDFGEISRYKGILKARNFEIFQDRLRKNGLAKYAKDFLDGSGQLQALCYKADIEAALRTPGFGGFQLLGLSDFPGQGTALVGVLNAFWEDKGYINAKQYNQFCNNVVPLARFPKMVYLNNETLKVPVEVAQFGPGIIYNPVIKWTISTPDGKQLFSGKFKKAVIPNGNCIQLGEISQSLSAIHFASRLMLSVGINNYHNTWDLFVYPQQQPHLAEDILVTQTLDSKTIEKLKTGGKVLLTLKQHTLNKAFGGDAAIGFSTIFWNTAWTNSQPPTTMGIVCDPKHPALKNFPTQAYSNWQWWDAMSHSNVFKLDAIKPDLQPIVRVIDDWVTGQSLGLIFECRVGKGKLIVSGIDLMSDREQRPEARQLMYSLKNYMMQNKFQPTTEIEASKLIALTDTKGEKSKSN